MHEKGGLEAQLTGERAASKVRDLLLDARFFCSKYEIDRGEDLLVEPEGYESSSDPIREPKIGLLQIKGTNADSECEVIEESAKLRLQISHLRRWAAIPLPIFVVRVELRSNNLRFFAESVDKIITLVAPDGLDELDQQTTTVHLPLANNLPGILKAQIESFYSAHAFRLANLSEQAIARNHYEIISSQTPFAFPSAKVWMKHIRVLWKGMWRPTHFWATLNHLADSLQAQYGGKPRPLYATIHIYRSLKDHRDNNAIAHISWIEDGHPDANAMRELINWPKTKHWSRFRFNLAPNLHSLPDFHADEEEDDAYLAKVKSVWVQFDQLTNRLRSSVNDNLQIAENVRKTLEDEFHELDDYLNNEIGQPSPQFLVMENMITQYAFALSGTFIWLKGKDGVSEIKRQRWLQQNLNELSGYLSGFQPLSKAIKGD